MLPSLAHAFNEAATRFSSIRTDLTVADAGILGSAGISRICSTTRAVAYVWTSATLEASVKANLVAVLSEINNARVPRNKIRFSLQSLLANSSLASLQTVRGLDMWDRRIQAIEDLELLTDANFNTSLLPLDGKTLRVQHFDAIWRVFGYLPPSLPQPVCRLALSDLATGRNELAHGHTTPVDFARTKTTTQVLRLLSLVEDTVEHLFLVADAYLTRKLYLR